MVKIFRCFVYDFRVANLYPRYLTCVPINAKKFQDFSHVCSYGELPGMRSKELASRSHEERWGPKFQKTRTLMPWLLGGL